MSNKQGAEDNFSKKIFSALFFAMSSSLITFVNKTILTICGFPWYEVLGIGQMTATITVLWICRRLQIIQIPSLSKQVAYRILPLSVMFLGNMVFGLGSTKELNLPMFSALRRISILMTMILEQIILGIRASRPVIASVLGMVVGAMIAVADDVTFSLLGYTFVLINDLFSAANGVYMKKMLDCKDLGMYGLLFYEASFMIIPATIIAWLTGELDMAANYGLWLDPIFLSNFLMSCIMGLVLSYSMMLCIHYNGALATTVVGSLKNILVTYVGMVFGGDYHYTWVNFLGLTVSVVASCVYTFVAFKDKSVSEYEPVAKTENVV